MKELTTILLRFLERHCHRFAELGRAIALLLGLGLALPASSALIVDAVNRTVTDSTTGLVWDQCTYGRTSTTTACDTVVSTVTSWANALKTAVTANTAGYKGFSDWRLPNKNELESIFKIDFYASGEATIDATAFPFTYPLPYWTSTTYVAIPEAAYILSFEYGESYFFHKANNRAFVRLVRGGQPWASHDALIKVPDAPVAPTATAGNTTASVSFLAPADNGGAITGYTVFSFPGGGVDSNAGSTALTHIMTGLTNGTTYRFSVRATNVAGEGSQSPPSNTVTPYVPPSPPAAPTASAGNTTASVSFVAPADNGSTITGYTVVSNPPGGIDSNAGTTDLTHTMTGLSNGTAYTFTVTATNSGGPGNASAASNSVTPIGAPFSPAAPTATAGNASATVSFAAPANNGSPITGYTVTGTPGGGGASVGCSTSGALICTVSGLTNGTAYTFTVTATNLAGTSSVSPASNSVTPSAPPSTPTAPIASAGDTTASVSFVAPANNGSAITGYTVVSNPAGGIDSNAGTTGLNHSITGLTNGTAYTFTVSATNGAGTSTASPASNLVTPAGLPATPAAPTTTAGDAAVKVSFVAPADNGSAITGYTVTGAPAGGGANVGCVTTGALTCTVSGLTNGSAYAFTVAATNAMGTSTPSASTTATPFVLIQPAMPLPGGGTAAVQIGAPPGCIAGSLLFNTTVPAGTPAGATFPMGVFRFTATGAGCANATLNVKIDFPAGSVSGLQPNKYGPPSAGAAPSWFAHGAIAGDTVTYTVIDNGAGDNNTQLAEIADPFAVVLLAAVPGSLASIPTLSEWALVLMSLMAAAIGIVAVRRRS
ncbi:MAG: IPTL-CTERM sorting domain-containing protein [Gammaproteobacteria bacterium]|nr:IPTL-CTERM sorting domain-containing protein [Gammaproteobacteria bacterium]MBU1819404.1 IPTL-CTERM sorting domain-containing protein [Gammaproteobacteria bacterium]